MSDTNPIKIDDLAKDDFNKDPDKLISVNILQKILTPFDDIEKEEDDPLNEILQRNGY